MVSAGGTGTYDINPWATEIQAGSYALMDTAYGKLGLPFSQALSVLATVVSVSAGWAVADFGPQGPGYGPRKPVDREGGGVVLLRRTRDLRTGRAGSRRRPCQCHYRRTSTPRWPTTSTFIWSTARR